jgi:guanylate kinase
MSEEEFEKMVARMALIEWKHLNDATPTSRMQSH